MATNYNPKTNNNGLVLCLDAGNVKSYGGTGSTFTDISKTKINSTITGTTFDSDSGSLVFASTSDYVTTGTDYINSGEIGSGNLAYTIEAVFRINDNSNLSANVLTGAASIIGTNSSGGIGLQVWKPAAGPRVNFGARSNSNFDADVPMTTGEWFHVLATRELGVNNRIYVNGVLSTTYTIANLDINATSVAMRMGYAPSRLTQALRGNIAFAKLYNTHFSDAQALQNFNAIRGRFGL